MLLLDALHRIALKINILIFAPQPLQVYKPWLSTEKSIQASFKLMQLGLWKYMEVMWLSTCICSVLSHELMSPGSNIPYKQSSASTMTSVKLKGMELNYCGLKRSLCLLPEHHMRLPRVSTMSKTPLHPLKVFALWHYFLAPFLS